MFRQMHTTPRRVAWAVGEWHYRGTSDTTFAPGTICTRAQGAALLYRAAGSPAVSGSAAFTDVPADAYYADAAAWAEQKGITDGIGNVCSVRITTAREHRSLRSCTDCTAANKQINRWKAAAGEYPCAVCLPILCAISRCGASCIPGQTAAIRAGKCHIFGKSAAMCHNFFFFCQTLLTNVIDAL